MQKSKDDRFSSNGASSKDSRDNPVHLDRSKTQEVINLTGDDGEAPARSKSSVHPFFLPRNTSKAIPAVASSFVNVSTPTNAQPSKKRMNIPDQSSRPAEAR
jgi:hypothetical protein